MTFTLSIKSRLKRTLQIMKPSSGLLIYAVNKFNGFEDIFERISKLYQKIYKTLSEMLPDKFNRMRIFERKTRN